METIYIIIGLLALVGIIILIAFLPDKK
jgi:hypothetical protein